MKRVQVINKHNLSVPLMPERQYDIMKTPQSDEIYVSKSWDIIWNMPIPSTPYSTMPSRLNISKISPFNNLLITCRS
jgi:hypothetical protein